MKTRTFKRPTGALPALAAALILTLSAGNAMAALEEADLLSPGDGLLTRDTETGLEWLDIPATWNHSYDEIMAGWGEYTSTHGFRYATSNEVYTLWDNAGIPDINGPWDGPTGPPVLSLQQLIGWNDYHHSAGLIYHTKALTDDLSAHILSYWTVAGSGHAVQHWQTAVEPDAIHETIGSYLVRSVSDPPKGGEIDGLILHDSFDNAVPFVREDGYYALPHTPDFGPTGLVRYWHPGYWGKGATKASHLQFTDDGSSGKIASFNYSGSADGWCTQDELLYPIGSLMNPNEGTIEFWYRPHFNHNDTSAVLFITGGFKDSLDHPLTPLHEKPEPPYAQMGINYQGWSGRHYWQVSSSEVDSAGNATTSQVHEHTHGDGHPDRFLFDAEEWMHFALVWKGDGISKHEDKTLILFINGVEVASSQEQFVRHQAFPEYLVLGSAIAQSWNRDRQGKNYSGASGDFDDLRVWSYAKTSAPSGGQNLLANPSFGTAETTSSHQGEDGGWSGDDSEIVAAENGITPHSGSQMLRFIHASNDGSPGSAVTSEVAQTVDLTPLADQIAEGRAFASGSFWVNRVHADEFTDTGFALELRALNRAGFEIARKTRPEFVTDGDADTWEKVWLEFPIPIGTEELVMVLHANENVFNDTSGVEFDGHYADSASLTIHTTRPVGYPDTFVNGERVELGPVYCRGEAEVSLATSFEDAWIFYTLDGSDPFEAGWLYVAPFLVDESVTLQAVAFSSDLSEWADASPVEIVVQPVVTADSWGGGVVAVDPPDGAYSSTGTVTLTATPDEGWSFLQWAGDTSGTDPAVELDISADRTAEAIFGTTMQTNVAGCGRIQVEPEMDTYPYGAIIRYTAIPHPGCYFVQWVNDASGTDNPLDFEMTTTEPQIGALFALLPPDEVAMTVIPSGCGWVAVTPLKNRYAKGETVTLRAIPAIGQQFTGWSGDATGLENPLELTLADNMVIEAGFTEKVDTYVASVGQDGCELGLTGDVGSWYELSASTNLVDWDHLTIIPNCQGTRHFMDAEAGSLPSRYYRARPMRTKFFDPVLSAKFVDVALHYSFDEDAGNVVFDSSVLGNHGRLVGNVPHETSIDGLGIRTSSRDTYVVCDSEDLDFNGWSAITVSGWLKLSGYTTYGRFINHGLMDAGGAFGITVGGVWRGEPHDCSFAVQLGEGESASVGVKRFAELGRWYHVVGVYDGMSVRYYVNGELEAQAEVPAELTGRTLYAPPGAELMIGKCSARREWSDTHINGLIDDVRIFHSALSPDAVMRLYRSGG